MIVDKFLTGHAVKKLKSKIGDLRKLTSSIINVQASSTNLLTGDAVQNFKLKFDATLGVSRKLASSVSTLSMYNGLIASIGAIPL